MTFLNLNLNKKINFNFFFKHVLFTFFWSLGILLLVFRVDVAIVDKLGIYNLTVIIPLLYIAGLVTTLFFLRWYWALAFLFYPILLCFWFIPKTILNKGKIYLFGNYISSVFSKFYHYKRSLFHFSLILIALIIYIGVNNELSRWAVIIVWTYFYIFYIYETLRESFSTPTLFGEIIEKKLKEFIQRNDTDESFVIKSYINQQGDDKLEVEIKKDKQITRSILAVTAFEIIAEKLNGFKTKQSYLLSSIIGAFWFLILSIVSFWFLNYQLYKVDPSNFNYNGNTPGFDFFYYTFKTITFGDIELVKPISIIARIVELSSFLIVGILFLVVIISVIFSMKQEQLQQDVKLTTELINCEKRILSKYFQNEFGVELTKAVSEMKNIDTSIKNLQNIIDKIL
ncbi:hypothetical protein ABIB50_002898 [Mucilaginibacter sp. UYCu711]